MAYDPNTHHRRSIRMHGYDYSQPGSYYVRLCEFRKQCIFGEVKGGVMAVNTLGEMVGACWLWLARHHEDVALDEWIVMPNHLHGIIVIQQPGEGGSRTAPTSPDTRQPGQGGSRTAPTSLDGRTGAGKPLGRLVGAFKTVCAQRVNELRGTPKAPLWQRDFYEHIIRNDDELGKIREYIRTNPLMWDKDSENQMSGRFAF